MSMIERSQNEHNIHANVHRPKLSKGPILVKGGKIMASRS